MVIGEIFDTTSRKYHENIVLIGFRQQSGKLLFIERTMRRACLTPPIRFDNNPGEMNA